MMSEKKPFNKFNSRSTGGAYRPPHVRNSNNRSNNIGSRSTSLPTQPASTASEALPIDPEAARRRKERFAGGAGKQREEYGFVSRGEDNRLQRDPQARVEFFKKIQHEFTDSLADSDVETIRRSLAKTSLDGSDTDNENKEQVDKTLSSLRKLREALLKFEPDDFAKSVFLYSIRLAAKVGRYQAYIPSINYLLKHKDILTSTELNEITNIYVLHLAHFNGSNDLALEMFYEHSKDDLKLGKILKAWRSKDYYTWLKLYHDEKDLQYHRMMQFGEAKMVQHSFNCLQKSYFQLPKSYITELYHMDFENLKAKFSCNWNLKDATVVIRTRN